MRRLDDFAQRSSLSVGDSPSTQVRPTPSDETTGLITPGFHGSLGAYGG